MAILVGKHTKVLVQGLTGSAGTFHAKQMREYGTAVVGGVTPGKGGTVHEGFKVFDTVQDAVAKTGANATVIYVPPPGAADAIVEAAAAGIEVIDLHHRGDPHPRHGAGQAGAGRALGVAARRDPTAPASSPRASARSGSCPATSTRRDRWGSSRARGP